ncbi:MAG: nucleoside hydrolase [Novosphingobium sp.]|nr:nucleoside hydrolase [Novosphingobium sp.]MCP5403836.1 nucleoside hydrolase [Novosphingobium sp.]
MKFDRRMALAGMGAVASWPPIAAAAGRSGAVPFVPSKGPKSRVLMVNDLSGDFDGLFAAAHAVMSPSIDLRGLISSNAQGSDQTGAKGLALGGEMLRLMRAHDRVPLLVGAETRLVGDNQAIASAGTRRIIDEAMRRDTRLPLFVAVGGGLTEVASALILQPEIAKRMTLVWIGGGMPDEYNFAIDPIAAQHIFNDTEVPIWQVPADVYAMCQVSMTELQAFVSPCGAIGAWLYKQALGVDQLLKNYPVNPGETWSMGDSPLVLLTALGDFAGRMGMNAYSSLVTPSLTARGVAQPRESGRKMRLYERIDTRLMFSDFYAKLKVNFGR